VDNVASVFGMTQDDGELLKATLNFVDQVANDVFTVAALRWYTTGDRRPYHRDRLEPRLRFPK